MIERVNCAVVQFTKDTPPLYYGRGVLSGDWYVSVESDLLAKEQIDQLVGWAEEEGEMVIRFPKPPHPRMVRLKWWVEGGMENSETTRGLMKIMETFPPISRD